MVVAANDPDVHGSRAGESADVVLWVTVALSTRVNSYAHAASGGNHVQRFDGSTHASFPLRWPE